MPNATITGSTTTTTVTFTSTHTSIQQLPPATFFGIPPELAAVFAGLVFLIIYAFFRLQVKEVPITLKWIFKTGSAVQFRVKQDLNGLFVNVLSARGKKLETLTQGADPLEVTILPEKVEFYINPKDRGDTLDDEAKGMLQKKGFKIEEKRRGKKNAVRGYVVYTEPSLKKVLAYLSVSLGGLKHLREYATIEGSGTTIDWVEKGKTVAPSGTSSSVIHEEMSAAKSWLHILADAAKGTWATLLLPLGCGVGIGGMAVMLVFILTGHFR